MNLTQAYNEQVRLREVLRRDLLEARALIERMYNQHDMFSWYTDARTFLARTEGKR